MKSTKRSRALCLFLGAALTVLAVGCKPKVGGKCKAGQASCTKDGELLCGTDGLYKLMPCRGPKGCAGTTQVQCDTSFAEAGEVCSTKGDYACSVDKKSGLSCGEDGTWKSEAACKGARGCEVKGDEIFCDSKIADEGDPCRKNGNYACTTDKKFIMRCDDHKMGKIASCRGDKGCQAKELPEEKRVEFVCDDWVADAQDPCENDGSHACAMDKASLYVCKGGKYVADRPCGGPAGCSVNQLEHKLSCDTGKGLVALAAGVSRSSSTVTPAHAGTPAVTPKPTVADAGAKTPMVDAGAATAVVDAGATKVTDAGASKVADAGATPPVKDAGAPVVVARADAGVFKPVPTKPIVPRPMTH